ncbi:hypothetical protein GCM10009021_13010 [Halarchaeum nitratireducens]|uniref:Uncharacterized protein n=1 Tax=Halarchaeum nitratireducens TaxID=489913 RepID=A0A830GAU6_9EURY|nr:hypothetical protein GCM10009021_13010 [Halarchaeum nitratireducens]
MFEVREEVETVGNDVVAALTVEVHDDPDAAVRACLGRVREAPAAAPCVVLSHM